MCHRIASHFGQTFAHVSNMDCPPAFGPNRLTFDGPSRQATGSDFRCKCSLYETPHGSARCPLQQMWTALGVNGSNHLGLRPMVLITSGGLCAVT